MKSKMRRIFRFDEASLNSETASTVSTIPSTFTSNNNSSTFTSNNNSSTLTSNNNSSTLTSNNNSSSQLPDLNSSQLPDLNNSHAGIYEDHPGLNPNDEQVVEYQCQIREKLEEITGDPQQAQIMAEALHAESDNIPFLESIATDLTTNGVASAAYEEALNLIGQAAANSPLEQFSIIPLIPMKLGNLYFSFTNPSLFMLLTLSLVLLLLHFVTKKGGGWSYVR